jgi:hypothetical protein
LVVILVFPQNRIFVQTISISFVYGTLIAHQKKEKNMKRRCVIALVAAGAAACAGYFAATKYKRYAEAKLRVDDAVDDLTDSDADGNIPVEGAEEEKEEPEKEPEKAEAKEPEKADAKAETKEPEKDSKAD